MAKKAIKLTKKQEKIQQKADEEQEKKKKEEEKKKIEEEQTKNQNNRRSSRNQKKVEIEEEPNLKRKAKVDIQDLPVKKAKIVKSKLKEYEDKKKQEEEEKKKKEEEEEKKKKKAKVVKSKKNTKEEEKKKKEEEEKKKKEEEEKKKKEEEEKKNKNKKSKKSKKDEDKSTNKDDDEEDEKIVTMITKNGYALDQCIADRKDLSVLVTSDRAYDATLNQTNCGANNNKFMHIQILKQESSGTHYMLSRWGRVGAKGQFKLDLCGSQQAGTMMFGSKIYSKTVKGDYKEIQIVTDDKPEDQEDKDKLQKKKEKKMESDVDKSKLAQSIKDLIRLIFDMNMMHQQMKEIGYDARKLPLGKLSSDTIKQGYKYLTSLATELKKKNPNSFNLTHYSSEFYSTIPHDFGFQQMSKFIINTLGKVTDKINLLSSLENIQIATKLLESDDKAESDNNLLDQNYDKLNSKLTPLKPSDPTFQLIQEYMTNSHAKTHSNYTLDIMDVFEVERQQDLGRFKEQMENKQLLWHGSRLTNYVGILSQGLRIAPPEAPVTGYMFGKGVYFADMVSKSANYCFTNRQNNIGILILCEVALGKPQQLKQSCYTADQLPKGTQSTKGLGSTIPDPKGEKSIGDVIVPCGKGVQDKTQGLGLLYNEYIVYDVAQIKMKYLIKTKFNY